MGQTKNKSIGKSCCSLMEKVKFMRVGSMIGPQRSLSILNMSWGLSL